MKELTDALRDIIMCDGIVKYSYLAAAPAPPAAQQDRLLSIIANTYQILGALDAPTHILDVLSDPLGATDTEIEAMLPFVLCGRIHTHLLKE